MHQNKNFAYHSYFRWRSYKQIIANFAIYICHFMSPENCVPPRHKLLLITTDLIWIHQLVVSVWFKYISGMWKCLHLPKPLSHFHGKPFLFSSKLKVKHGSKVYDDAEGQHNENFCNEVSTFELEICIFKHFYFQTTKFYF